MLLILTGLVQGVGSQDSPHRDEARQVLAQTGGALTIRGLEKPVTVMRDEWGIPHIYAETQADLFFAQEHNSAWYYFDVQVHGELVLEIIPEKSSDDYDFLLFHWPDTSCCHDPTELPVRTNIY